MTELVTINFGSGLSGFGLGFFGSVFRLSVNMPTPSGGGVGALILTSVALHVTSSHQEKKSKSTVVNFSQD